MEAKIQGSDMVALATIILGNASQKRPMEYIDGCMLASMWETKAFNPMLVEDIAARWIHRYIDSDIEDDDTAASSVN